MGAMAPPLPGTPQPALPLLPGPYAQFASSPSWPAAFDFSSIGFPYGTQYVQLPPVGPHMAHFPCGTPAQYFYPQWGQGIGHVRQSESSASSEVYSSCPRRKIRKIADADADVQTRLVEMEEHCAELTSKLSKETKRANQENARAEQERARAEQERALRKEQTKRAKAEAKRADREAGRAEAAETKAEVRRKAADAWRKKAERARDKLAD